MVTETKPKLFKVIVDNTSIMYSIESAHITVTSPSGEKIFLPKMNLCLASKEQREVFWKCCKDPMVSFVGEVELTKQEMQLALDFSKLKYAKKK